MADSVHFNFRQQINRRTFLRGAGATLALPWLSAMNPAFAAPTPPPRRFVAMTLSLGLHAENLNPKTAGRNYESSRYLKGIEDLRDQFTVVSGSSHPGVTGGHRAEASLLTANPMSSSAQTRNTISLDQYMAKQLGNQTRYSSLVLGLGGTTSPSYTENGAMIAAQTSPSKLFAQLFINDSRQQREYRAQMAREGQSIMDIVAEDARSLKRRLGAADRDRLDAYFTSVRALEQQLVESEGWAHRPKPKVAAKPPVDVVSSSDVIARQRLMSEMVRLAFATDSTRVVTLHLGGGGAVIPIEGVEQGYHNLSHHGRDEEKLEQLALVEAEIIRAWGDFLRDLQNSSDVNENLLETTSVLLTSNLGNGSNHDNRNMPVLLAGGGFRHGQHLAFDQKNNYPLPNLYVSLLQRMGLEVDQFATGKTTMKGLEFA